MIGEIIAGSHGDLADRPRDDPCTFLPTSSLGMMDEAADDGNNGGCHHRRSLLPRRRSKHAESKMGSAKKGSKRVRDASISNSEGNIEQERDVGLDSDRSEDFEQAGEMSESYSKDESDQEREAEDEEEEGSDDELIEGQRDAEMEDLEKEYLNLRNEEQNILKNLKRHKDEDALKGQAVKNQKALWDKTLEFRFLLQKAFSSSNKLPQENVRSSFCNSDNMVAQAYSDLISSSEQTLSCMQELQEALLDKNPAIFQGNNKESDNDGNFSNELEGENDEDWLPMHRMYCRIAPFRNTSVDKWQRKTQVTTGAAALKRKLHAFNQNISDQVAGYMRDPSRMIKRMQAKRSSVRVFGKVHGDSENNDSATAKQQDEVAEGDPELLDDSEFYQQLLKEFFESCDLASSETAFYALKKLQPKKRKIVDQRASKSRKIRYNVHEKIVNFMAPLPMVLPPMAPKLFENLFGAGNQKPATVV